MTTIAFCPPPMPTKSLLTQAHLLPTPTPTKLGAPSSHATLVGSFPLTTSHIPSPSPTPTILVPTPPPSSSAPPLPPLKRKRVVHPEGSQPKKRKANANAAASSSAGAAVGPSPPNRSRSPTTTLRPTDDSESDEFDYSIFAQTTQNSRRSTPVVKEGSFAFGAREEYTLFRETRTEDRRQQLRCGIEEDGRVDALSSEDVVRPLLARYYKPYFHNPDDPSDKYWDVHPTDYPYVDVEYPNHCASERYILLVPSDKDHYNPIMELMNGIYTMIGYYLLPHEQAPFGTLPPHLQTKSSSLPPSITPTTESPPKRFPPPPDHLRNLEKAYNTHNGPLFVQSVRAINALVRGLKGKMMQNVKYGWDGVPPAVWKAVVEECYQRCVGPNVKELGKYVPFSDTVYGELNASFVSDIVFRTNLKANRTFVDLGCGVGNCLLQTALQVGCTSVGIEINPPPASLGKVQIEQFRKRLRLWGLNAGKVDLRQGDFCEDDDVRGWVVKADVVLVNNWAFSAKLNEKLSLLFLDLPEGAQIVSLKPFRRPDFRLTERTVSSPQAIFRIEEVEFRRGAVSWMAEGGVYYLHTVDREPLRKFTERSEKMRGSGHGGRKRRNKEVDY